MRKQRVATRSKVRFQRRRRNGAVIAVALLAGLGFFAIRQLRLSGHSPREFLDALRVRSVAVEGALGSDRAGAQAALAAYVGRPLLPLSRDAVAADLAARFPALRVERVQKEWTRLSLRVSLAPRTALARCAEAGRSRPATGGRYLDDAGEVFPAPPEPGQETLPLARGICGGTDDARRDLSSLLAQWNGSPHGTLVLADVAPAPDGWTLDLADGTRVLWGSAASSGPKAGRLAQVVEDGKRRYGAVLSADLRFFDQGKVVVRPVTAHKAAAGQPGGTRI